MSAPKRPAQRRRPGGPNGRREHRWPWWYYPIAIVLLLVLGGAAWGSYAIWFAVAHVRATQARVSGLVVMVGAKDDTRVQQVLVRTGDEVREAQVVALLDKADLEAQVDQAKAYLSAQKSALDRAEKELALTIRQKAASVHEAEAELAAANARLARARAERQLQSHSQPDEVRRAEADVASARSQLDDAEATLRRMERLHDEGAISQGNLDAARTDCQVAQAAVDAAEAALAVAKARDYEAGIRQQDVATREAEEQRAAAALDSARTDEQTVSLMEQEVLAKQAAVDEAEAALQATEARLSDAVLRSPVNGVVVRGYGHSVKDGEVVVKGMPIVTVVSTDVPLWINAKISELYADRVREGQPVLIRIDAFRRHWFHGKVEKVGRATEFVADESSPWAIQQVPVKLSFDPESRDVKHGMTCRVWIEVRGQ